MDVLVSLNAPCFVDSDRRTTPDPCAMIAGLWGNVIGLGLRRSANSTPSVLFMNATNQRAAKDSAMQRRKCIFLGAFLPIWPRTIHLPVSFAPLESSFRTLYATLSTMTTNTVRTQTTALPRLAIKNEHLAGLDPEWVELWHEHGAHMVRADELSLEEYRRNPALYSFTYPTCAG
jgi:hypothetical protein